MHFDDIYIWKKLNSRLALRNLSKTLPVQIQSSAYLTRRRYMRSTISKSQKTKIKLPGMAHLKNSNDIILQKKCQFGPKVNKLLKHFFAFQRKKIKRGNETKRKLNKN